MSVPVPNNELLNPPTVNDLIDASRNGNLPAVKSMLAGGLDINEKNIYGDTALMFTVTFNSVEVARLLIARGANVNEKSRLGYTALILAAKAGNTDITRLLLDNGADMDEKDKDGKTALDLATEKGAAAVVQLLNEASARAAEKKARQVAAEEENIRHAGAVERQKRLKELAQRYKPKFGPAP